MNNPIEPLYSLNDIEPPFFVIKNLSHSFYKKNFKVELFHDISFSLKENQIIAITGKSGIGKSTFLNIAAGLDNALEGEIIFDGCNIARLKESKLAKIRNEKIGFIFQHFNLIKELNVIENIMLPGLIYNNHKKLKKRALELLQQVGLGNRFHQNISELSGGELQRTAIARALINNPKIIFADEPTGNLDENNSLQIMNLFQSICKKNKCSVLLVTHSLPLAKMCDFSYKIENKKITKITV